MNIGYPDTKNKKGTSPLHRRDLSGKEERLHGKAQRLKKKKWKAEDKAFDTGKERHERKEDRLERRELKTKQKLSNVQRKQSRKKFGLGKDPHKKNIKAGQKTEREELKIKQARQKARR